MAARSGALVWNVFRFAEVFFAFVPLQPRCARPPPPVRGRNLVWLRSLCLSFSPARGRWRAVAYATSDGGGDPAISQRAVLSFSRTVTSCRALDPDVLRGERRVSGCGAWIYPRFALCCLVRFACLFRALAPLRRNRIPAPSLPCQCSPSFSGRHGGALTRNGPGAGPAGRALHASHRRRVRVGRARARRAHGARAHEPLEVADEPRRTEAARCSRDANGTRPPPPRKRGHTSARAPRPRETVRLPCPDEGRGPAPMPPSGGRQRKHHTAAGAMPGRTRALARRLLAPCPARRASQYRVKSPGRPGHIQGPFHARPH